MTRAEHLAAILRGNISFDDAVNEIEFAFSKVCEAVVSERDRALARANEQFSHVTDLIRERDEARYALAKCRKALMRVQEDLVYIMNDEQKYHNRFLFDYLETALSEESEK